MPTTSGSKQWIHADDYASPALLELLDMQLTKPIVEYVVEQATDTVEHGTVKQSRSSSSFFNGRGRRRDNWSKHVPFATEVLSRSRATMPTILATLVYIDRVRSRLHIMCEDYAFERVFLGALIIARKFIHDCNYRCKHWASFTGVFGPRDISRIEREFLEVLQFDLTFSEKDLLAHHDQLVNLMPHHHSTHRHLDSSHRSKSPIGSAIGHHTHPTLASNPSHPHFTPERLLSSPRGSSDLTRSNPLSPYSPSPFGGSSSDSSSSDSEDSMSPPTPPPATVVAVVPATSPRGVVVTAIPVTSPRSLEGKKRSSIMSLFRPNIHHHLS